MGKSIKDDQITIAKIIRITLIVVCILVASVVLFFVFDVQVKSRAAFRDAKNVYLALNSVEIEYYAQGKSIYDPTSKDNMSEGVAEKVKALADNEGTYRIVSYDVKKHNLTGLIYNNGNYYVEYSSKNGSSKWEVKYMMTISRYDD